MNSEFVSLHEKAVEIAKKFHEAESALIDILQRIDDHKIFLDLGYSSLFDYAVRALRLSEANSSNFITVARKSKVVPELKEAIKAGDITVSKARKITPVLTVENKDHWLLLAKTLPKPQLEREVAKVMPELQVQERARFVSESRLELKLGLSEEAMKDLRRAQDILSQKLGKSPNLEETLEKILKFYLDKEDPVEKAKRNIKSASNSIDDANAAASVPGTRYIPTQTKHQINLRDVGQCTQKDLNGNRCTNTRWVEVHHQVPLFFGGTNDLNNLQTLCSVHHKMQHRSHEYT